MLFLYRPRQTWMPIQRPWPRTDQYRYNLDMQQKFRATHQVPPPVPATSAEPEAADPVARLKDLAQLHASGALSDAEFAAAKAKVLE